MFFYIVHIFSFLSVIFSYKIKTIVIGPIRPIYIKIIITIFPTNVSVGVRPAVNPTVAKAEKNFKKVDQ